MLFHYSQYIRKIFTLFLVGGVFFISFAQKKLLDSDLGISGKIMLFQSLDSIRFKGVNLIYSADKLTNQQIEIKKEFTINDFLTFLNNQNIAAITYEREQIIVRPYTPITYTIHGVLKDVESSEHIIGATISIEGTTFGTISNGYGYYSLTLKKGNYRLKFAHIGYQSYQSDISISKDIYFNLSLSPKLVELEEIEVTSATANRNLTETIPSINHISITNSQIPYFLGEVDVIQNALLKPGISTIGEDASGIHIRGGNVDQNLILLDEATIYNPNHLYGLISIFNPEAVNNVQIMKGYIPPSYGGRSSAVIEVRQKEGNANKMSFSGGIGPISARALVEGPILKNKISFLLSGRYSLLNLSLDDFGSNSVQRNKMRFQDLNLKLNFKYSKSNSYYLSGYIGNDQNRAGLSSTRNWGNRILNFRWNHLFSPRLFSLVSLFYSSYNYQIENSESPSAFVNTSNISDIGIKANLTSILSPKNELSYGFNLIYHRLTPGIQEPLNLNTNTVELESEKGLESALFISHKTNIANFFFDYGLRISSLHTFGPGAVFQYKKGLPLADSTITDLLQFNSFDLIYKNINFEPRISVNWRLNNKTSLKASFNRSAQYLHLISNTISPSPSDIWKLSGPYINPIITNQYTLGIYKNLKSNNWELSSEIYYKDTKNNIQYKNNADLIFNENIETELLFTDTRSYGLEFYIKKRRGKIQGWVSYTLSRTESNFIENGKEQFVLEDYDKTHNFSTSWSMKLSPRLSISTNFLFNTGIPITLPTDKYTFENILVPHFSAKRNETRLPSYHRLDLSVKWDGPSFKKKGTKKRKNKDYWIFTIYNVYARQNAYSYFYRTDPVDPTVAQIVQYSIFGTIIPSVTYNFKF